MTEQTESIRQKDCAKIMRAAHFKVVLGSAGPQSPTSFPKVNWAPTTFNCPACLGGEEGGPAPITQKTCSNSFRPLYPTAHAPPKMSLSSASIVMQPHAWTMNPKKKWHLDVEPLFGSFSKQPKAVSLGWAPLLHAHIHIRK